MTRLKTNLFLVLVGLVLLVNPMVPYVIGLPVMCLIMAWVSLRMGVSNTIFAFIFFIPFTLLVRWDSPESFLSAGFRSFWLIFYLAIFIFKGYRIRLSRNGLALLILTLLTFVGIIFHSKSGGEVFFIIREYVIFFLFYLIIESYFTREREQLKYIIPMLALSGVFLAFFNIMFYTGILNFPFQSIVIEGNNYSQRVVGPLEVFRMSSILGVSAGGTAIYYTICLVSLVYLWSFGKGLIWKGIILSSAGILILADVFLISFSMITTAFFFVLAFLIARYNKKLMLVLLVAIPTMAVLFSLIKFTTSIGEVSLLGYILYLFQEYTISLFSNAEWHQWIIGQGFDVKSSQVDRSTTIKRDFGVFSTFVSGGAPYAIVAAYIIISSIRRCLYLFKSNYSKPEAILLLGMLFSVIAFLHGSPVTTRPIDFLFFLTVAAINCLFNYARQQNLYSRPGIQGQ